MLAAPAERYLPALGWLLVYRRDDLSGDLIAGAITAILLVPQAMAYSLLAGLPPEVGLYASIAPPILYAFFGSSRALAVGPVAVASLMVAHALTTIAPPGSTDYSTAALTLAAMVGLLPTAMGLARLGFLANFLSHPVMSGFTSAAAIVIAFSQLKHLFGVDAPSHLRIDQLLLHLWQNLRDVNLATLSIGLGAIATLLFMRRYLSVLLVQLGLPRSFAGLLVKAAPLVLVAVTTMIAALWRLDQTGGLVVAGNIPAGLPPLTAPSFDRETWASLASAAVSEGASISAMSNATA